MSDQPRTIGPVVSSAHLASGAMPELSEMEFGLIMASNAFSRWVARCMAAAGEEGLSPLEGLILHNVNHRGRAKRLADICLMMNIEDTHIVAYALKKLETRGLVESRRVSKEKTVAITSAGEQACLAYREIREAALVRAVREMGVDSAQVSRLAALLRALSGQYDQAARAAASL
ncbi:MAG: winged helix DNA-binding protein [Paracoccaceae bacterium]